MALFRKSTRTTGPLERAKLRKQARQPRFAVFVALTFSGMVAGLVVLATQTEVPQITRAPGTILPVGDYAQIETMESGIVRKVHVRDGQAVEAGDVLVDLHHPDLKKEKEVLTGQLFAIKRDLANANAVLDALARNTVPEPSHIRHLRDRGFVSASAVLDLYFESQRIKRISLAQQQETLEILKTALSFAQERVGKKGIILKRYAKLHEQGLTPLSDFQDEEDDVDALQAAVSDAEVRLAEAQNALTLREKTLAEVFELENEQAQVAVSLEVVRSKISALRLVAPVGGIVQAVAYPNPGEVIEPGETVFELLPTRQALVVEARIPNSEVGHVQADHPVMVSIDTFDVRHFGKVEGYLSAISPLPLVDERTGETYFRASFQLAGAKVGTGHFERPLQAGMTVVAEMNTGEQTLLAYMLKPVQQTMERTFSER